MYLKPSKIRATPPAGARGFSLLEVMVALVIIAVGMLGIAKMQGLAMSSTTASRSRALAAIEASSLAAAMQANRSYWSSASSTPGLISITTSANNATFVSSNAGMQSALTTVGGTLCTALNTKVSCYCAKTYSAPCSPSANALALAASDLYDFGQSLAGFLPAATATISCAPLDNPVDCTIYIVWNENTVAMTTQQATQSANNGATVQVSYYLYVVP